MADITQKCPACGFSCTLSEFATEDARRCGRCGALLTVPRLDGERIRLQLQSREAPQSEPAVVQSPEGAPSLPSAHAILDRKAEYARQAAKGVRHSSPVVGWIIFLVCAAGLIGAQFAYVRVEDFRDTYRVLRLAYLALACVLVLYDAFRDSTPRGFMCLFIPFYVFFYAITRVDSYWRQGVFLAAVVMIGTEMLFFPKDALITIAETEVNVFVRYVAGMINRAGDSPTP